MAARRGELLVVGVGIQGVGQATLEAAAAIQRADRVFYVVADPTMALWIRELNATAASLYPLYGVGKDRRKTYAEMSDAIVNAVTEGHNVCAVFYGHPGVLVQSSHDAIRRVRRRGYQARMLPAVSSDGCLYAELGINPGDHGIQSFEATDFLLARRRFDATSGLLLWQVGAIGDMDATKRGFCHPARLAILAGVLKRHYRADHRVVLYQSSTFPAMPSAIKRIRLNALPTVKVRPSSLLYVPPCPQRPISQRLLSRLQRE